MPHQCSYLTQLETVWNEMTEATYYLGTTTFLHHCFCLKPQALLSRGNSHLFTMLPYAFLNTPPLLHKNVPLQTLSFFPIFAAREPNSINKVMFLVIWAQTRFVGLANCYQLNSACLLGGDAVYHTFEHNRMPCLAQQLSQ